LISPFLVVLTVLIGFSSTSSAQQLSIKRQWFTGSYKYSTDGVNYYKFGKGWNDLKDVVKSNEEALRLVNSARSLNILSNIFGGVGGFLLGWNIGTELGGKEAEPSIWVAGGVLLVTGMTTDIVANSKIHRAAKVYNSGIGTGSHGSRKFERLLIALSPRYVRVTYFF